jgi:hypothetical protein
MFLSFNKSNWLPAPAKKPGARSQKQMENNFSALYNHAN